MARRAEYRPGLSRAAQMLSLAAERLRLHGNETMSAADLRSEVERTGGCRPGSVLPSDFCYNRLNRDPNSGRHCLFEWLGKGLYRYLGPGCPYTGSVYWRPGRRGTETIVGEWREGVRTLTHDPREGAGED